MLFDSNSSGIQDVLLWITHCHLFGIVDWQHWAAVHGSEKRASFLFPLSVQSTHHQLSSVYSHSLSSAVLVQTSATAFRPREYLSNVKLSGLVVDVASVASLVLSHHRRPLTAGGKILQLLSHWTVVFANDQLAATLIRVPIWFVLSGSRQNNCSKLLITNGTQGITHSKHQIQATWKQQCHWCSEKTY